MHIKTFLSGVVVLAGISVFGAGVRAQEAPAAVAAPAAASVESKFTFPKTTVDHAGLKKLGWQLACQCWTFREMSLFETIDVCKALGVHHLEIYNGQRLSPTQPDVKVGHDMTDEQIATLKAKLKAAGLDVVSYGVVDLGATEESARKVFEFGKKIGLKKVVTETPQEQLEMADKLAGEYQINVALHNHPKPSRYWDCKTTLAAVEGRSERVGACADIGHWRRSGLTPAECVKALKGRILEVHLKDIDAEKNDVPFTTGTVGVEDVMNELKAQGFKGNFSIEYEKTNGQELIDNVSKSINAFSAVVTKLAAE